MPPSLSLLAGGQQIQGMTEDRVWGTLHSQSEGRHITIPSAPQRPILGVLTFRLRAGKNPQHFLTRFSLIRVGFPILT